MDMYHRPFVWAGREASILVFCIILLGAGCAAPSATPLPTVVSSVATVTSTGISTTAPAPPTATSAPPTPTQPEATLPPSTPTSAATMVPLVLQAIQPLGKSEIVDTPMRGLRVITDGTRKYRIAAWSPRGSFAAATPQDGPGIDVIDLESGTVTSLVSDTYVLEPRWTSDGQADPSSHRERRRHARTLRSANRHDRSTSRHEFRPERPRCQERYGCV